MDTVKPKVFWGTPEKDVVGNSYGYAYHNRMLKQHVAPYVEFSDSAKIVFQTQCPEFYLHVMGKKNVLMTMWEFLDLPEKYKVTLGLPEYVLVPCKFCKDLFAPYTQKPPIVCYEGIESDKFPYKERNIENGQRFRYLWLGASNPRKGYHYVAQATALCDKFPNMEIYFKTTMPVITWMGTIKNTIKNWNQIARNDKDQLMRLGRIFSRIPSPFNANKVFVYGKNKNVIVDTRRLPQDELLALYHSAHCFLFPSLGEGWGLTLMEAMATGCPAVGIDVTGCAEFFDEDVGYPIKMDIHTDKLPNYDMEKCRMYAPVAEDFFKQMLRVPMEYSTALKKAKKASDRIHSKFSWEKSGQRLGQIFREVNSVSLN